MLEPLVEARKYYEPGALYAIATSDMAVEIDVADGRLTTQEVGLASGRGPVECHESLGKARDRCLGGANDFRWYSDYISAWLERRHIQCRCVRRIITPDG